MVALSWKIYCTCRVGLASWQYDGFAVRARTSLDAPSHVGLRHWLLCSFLLLFSSQRSAEQDASASTKQDPQTSTFLSVWFKSSAPYTATASFRPFRNHSPASWFETKFKLASCSHCFLEFICNTHAVVTWCYCVLVSCFVESTKRVCAETSPHVLMLVIRFTRLMLFRVFHKMSTDLLSTDSSVNCFPRITWFHCCCCTATFMNTRAWNCDFHKLPSIFTEL